MKTFSEKDTRINTKQTIRILPPSPTEEKITTLVGVWFGLPLMLGSLLMIFGVWALIYGVSLYYLALTFTVMREKFVSR